MKIGVIGLGTVGYGVIEILTNEKTRLEKEMKQEIVVINDSNIYVLKSLNNCKSFASLYSGNTICIKKLLVIDIIIYWIKLTEKIY